MDPKAAVLLPSQTSLLHSLQRMAQYGIQSTVLIGGIGSGKTTIVTALPNRLESVFSVFLTCPQYASLGEIRRKLLIQLLPEKLFDDQDPLPETLLKQSDYLALHTHIVLDDAQFLPLDIWFECLELSRILTIDKKVSFTFTALPDFLPELLTQLTEFQKKSLLPIEIDILSEEEQEGLYYSLLKCSEHSTVVPYEVMRKQLCLESGTIGEAVSQFSIILDHGKTEAVAKSRLLPSLVCLLMLMMFVWGYFMVFPESRAFKLVPQLTMMSVNASKSNYAYADLLLAPYFEQREEHAPLSSVDSEVLAFQNKPFNVNSEDKLRKPQDNGLKLTSTVDVVEIMSKDNISTTESINSDGEETFSQISTEIPTKGFVLQVASVKHLDSLQPIIKKLGMTEQIRIAKYHQWWVVLYGNFESRKEARQESKRLQRDFGLSAPWLRRWTELSEFQLQQVPPIP